MLFNQEDIRFYLTVTFCDLIIRLRGKHADGHEDRVAQLTLSLAINMGLPSDQVRMIYRSARLHDIGKVVVPDEVIHSPNSLNDFEWVEIKTHSLIGARILLKLGCSFEMSQNVLHHHDNWDGSGYPTGFARDNIPIGARIIRVADMYDAMTSDRAYQNARIHEQALIDMESVSGTSLDPLVFDVFKRMMANDNS